MKNWKKSYIEKIHRLKGRKDMQLNEIAREFGLESENLSQVSGYQIDSRFVREGELFFALKGAVSDGHQFLHEVRQKGAVGAVVDKGTICEGLPLLEVEDVLLALQSLAQASIALKPPGSIVGITGSVGKTTTKEFLATLLEGKFRVGKTSANYNSQRTFPLGVLNRTGTEEILVLEMGMSESGEITKLVNIAPPEVAVITKISLAHTMNFADGLNGIARAKAEICSHPNTKTAIIDLDFLQYREAVEMIRAEKITFSITDATADYYLSFGTGRFRIDERGVRAYEFELPFKESHVLHNFTAALVAARQLGMQWEEIERQISALVLPKMRFEQFEKDGIRFINDAYNANPASMRAALENLPLPQEGGKRIAVLGTMKELGAFSQEAHEEIGKLAQKYVDVLLCLGGDEISPLCAGFEEAKKPLERFADHETLTERLREIMRPGDVVLVKGSRSMQMEKIMEYLDVALTR